MQPSKVPSVVALIESKGLKVWTDHYYQGQGLPASTSVYIFDGDHCIATGSADCSPKDNFNRKMGRAIALGRAWKELNGRIKAAGAIGSQAFDS